MPEKICCPKNHPTISSLCSCDHAHHCWETNCVLCRQRHKYDNLNIFRKLNITGSGDTKTNMEENKK